MNEADTTNSADPQTAMANMSVDNALDEKNTPPSSSSYSPELVAMSQIQFSSNIDHLNQVKELRQALAESQQAINEYKEQANVRESLLDQHVQELAATQSQMQRLWQELETAHQTVQRQQILIETLTAQVESSQERVAQLEREFALNQQRYNEQSYKLAQTENACRELHSRLSRQQSHTLQFKVALEKCLGLPLPGYQLPTEDFLPNFSPSATLFSPIPNSPYKFKTTPELPPILLPKAQPISSWSITASENDVNGLPILKEDSSSFMSYGQHSSQSAQLNDAIQPSPVETSHDTTMAAPQRSAGGSSSGAPVQAQEFWESDNSEPEPQYQDLFSLLEVGAESAVVDSPELVLPQEKSETPTSDASPTDTDWLSPVVYPSRPPKGRKSFAAVELPVF